MVHVFLIVVQIHVVLFMAHVSLDQEFHSVNALLQQTHCGHGRMPIVRLLSVHQHAVVLFMEHARPLFWLLQVFPLANAHLHGLEVFVLFNHALEDAMKPTVEVFVTHPLDCVSVLRLEQQPSLEPIVNNQSVEHALHCVMLLVVHAMELHAHVFPTVGMVHHVSWQDVLELLNVMVMEYVHLL